MLQYLKLKISKIRGACRDVFIIVVKMNCFKIQSVSCYRYVLVRGLITEDEMKKLKYALENSEDIRNNVQERSDGDGAISKLCLWNYAGKKQLLSYMSIEH